MDFIISLVVILIFVAASLKKSGQLDEIMNGMKKKKQNEADSVVYEQTEDMPKKKKAKAPERTISPGAFAFLMLHTLPRSVVERQSSVSLRLFGN